MMAGAAPPDGEPPLDHALERRRIAFAGALADRWQTDPEGSLTFALVRAEGEWLIAAIQNTPIHGDLPRQEEWMAEEDPANGESAWSMAHGIPVSGGRARLPSRLRARDPLAERADDAGDDSRSRDA